MIIKCSTCPLIASHLRCQIVSLHHLHQLWHPASVMVLLLFEFQQHRRKSTTFVVVVNPSCMSPPLHLPYCPFNHPFNIHSSPLLPSHSATIYLDPHPQSPSPCHFQLHVTLTHHTHSCTTPYVHIPSQPIPIPDIYHSTDPKTHTSPSPQLQYNILILYSFPGSPPFAC